MIGVFRKLAMLAGWLLMFLPTGTEAEIPQATLYYVRYDVTTVNHCLTETRLTSYPDPDEYRLEPFQTIQVTGIAGPRPGMDVLDAAKHNALANLLLRHGLESVKSKTTLTGNWGRDEVRMRYEGVVRHPYKVLSQGYWEAGLFYVNLEVSFCPIAFPTQWSFLRLKQKIGRTIESFLSVFR